MALPIEDQIHHAFIQIEEDRCQKLEQEKGKYIKRRKVDKPWTRSSPLSLCQEFELLVHVKEFDYDLSDENFKGYCEARGVLQLAGEPGSKRWEYVVTHSRNKDEFLNERSFQYAQEIEGTSYKYSAQEMDTHWEILCLWRASIQDCWEIYRLSFKGI